MHQLLRIKPMSPGPRQLQSLTVDMQGCLGEEVRGRGSDAVGVRKSAEEMCLDDRLASAVPVLVRVMHAAVGDD